MAANANGNIAKSNEPVQLVNREVYEIVNARLQTYAEIGGQYKGGLGSLKDLSDARWICDKVLGGLAEEDAHSFEELQNFIQTARKRFDLSKLTKSEWLQLVNLRPKDTGTFEAIVKEAAMRFPEIYDAEENNLLLNLIIETFHSDANGQNDQEMAES